MPKADGYEHGRPWAELAGDFLAHPYSPPAREYVDAFLVGVRVERGSARRNQADELGDLAAPGLRPGKHLEAALAHQGDGCLTFSGRPGDRDRGPRGPIDERSHDPEQKKRPGGRIAKGVPDARRDRQRVTGPDRVGHVPTGCLAFTVEDIHDLLGRMTMCG